MGVHFFKRQVWALTLGALASIAPMAQAASPDLVISQIYGGGGSAGAPFTHDIIEVFNRGLAPVNLNGWSVQYASATGSSWSNKTLLTNIVLAPGQYYLLQGASNGANGVALPAADVVGSINLSGTAGKVALVNSTSTITSGITCPTAAEGVVDLVAYGTTASNCAAMGVTPAPSVANAVKRAAAGCTDTDNNPSDFAAASPAPRNTATALNPCSAGANISLSVSSTSGAEASASQITVTATASSPLAADAVLNLAVSGSGISPGDYSLSSPTITIASGQTVGSVIFTVVDDAQAEGAESALLTLSNPPAGYNLGVASQTINIADNDGALTPIYQIQGSGSQSALLGQLITTSAVVTRLNNNGFFMQDALGDGDALTSDGIFVFTSSAPTVQVGQLIQLTGTVAEFNTGAAGNADTLAHKVTQLTSPSGISVISSGNVIAPLPVTLPETINDDLERYEGMLVTLAGPLTASQNYFQGRYGQVTLSVNGRMEIPTNKFRPNTAQAINLAYANVRSRIILDDGTSTQNPNPTPYIGVDNTLRAGDTVAQVTGVIDYGLATSSNTGFGDYKIHPTSAVSFSRANVRTNAPEMVAGNIKVASFNVLNFFTTFTDGTTADGLSGQGCSLGGNLAAGNCRGASNLAEFNRQRSKIIAAIGAINADVVGLMEIQNNGNVAVQNLVDGLNSALGAGTYAALPLPGAGSGDDAIRVAMIYKPASLALVGSAQSDTDAIHNRPPLLQTFASANGQQFSLVVNHFKSKGSCPDAGSDPTNEDAADGQGCWNGRRLLQAQRLRTWLASLGANHALIIGDLNAYAQEDPIIELTNNGYVDQIGAFNSFGYSYVFDGAAGRLDHAISSSALSPWVAGVKLWHINADEPSIIDYNLEFKQPACPACGPDYYTPGVFRSSDHDPVIVGLHLNDKDGDGLSDALEASLGSDPTDVDSDDDGLADGSEDANRNGSTDGSETSPSNADSDSDGLQDGTEKGVTTAIADPDGAGPLKGTNTTLFIADLDPASTTNPTSNDTDADGAPDGSEDNNHNGRFDAGEYDPLNPLSNPFGTGASRQVPLLPIWAMLLFAISLVALQQLKARTRFR